MKTQLTLLALASATLTALPALPAAKASDYDSCERVYVRTVDYCRPVKVCTREVCRRSFCRVVAYDHCGYPVSQHFTQVTFQEEFSDGSTRSFTRTFPRG